MNDTFTTETYEDTIDGERRVGIKAYGDYKGFHIERRCSMPRSLVDAVEWRNMRLIAEGQYRRECEAIDEKLKQDKG